MPELPEVEACRRLAERHCAGKRILAAQVAEDEKVIVGLEPVKLQAALQGRTVRATARKGKHMWIDFDSGPSLMLHFGMTGSLVVKGVRSHQYKNFKVGDPSEWPPKYWKLLLDLEGGVSLAFSDPRRFARLRLQETPQDHEPVSLLGFDPVLSMPPLLQFTSLVKAQKRSLKVVLLDQAFSAGVGNWVADEVLYQGKLHPELKANSLTDTQIRQLYEAIQQVPEAAVEAEADSEKFPPDWLFHVRWGGEKSNPEINGNPVKFLKVGGRTTAYVPAVQKAAARAAASQAKGRAKGKAKQKAESGQDDLSEEGEEDEDQAQAGTGKGAKKQGQKQERVRKKKKGRPSAADGGKAAGKGNASGGVKQAEEEDQPASESEEEAAESKAAEEEEEAKPSRRGAASLPKSPSKKRKSGEEEQDASKKLHAVGPGNNGKGTKGKQTHPDEVCAT